MVGVMATHIELLFAHLLEYDSKVIYRPAYQISNDVLLRLKFTEVPLMPREAHD